MIKTKEMTAGLKSIEIRAAGVSTALCMATLSLFSLSSTPAADDRIVVEHPIPSVTPVSTHQVMHVNGVGYMLPISDWNHVPDIPASLLDDETIWLARAIYSETKDPREMELVAWVVRNRVETRYRGQRTYRGVVVDPHQFSAFNADSPTRGFYMSLLPRHNLLGWQEALRVAYLVRTDDGRRRPFSQLTRHFYSEVSMIGSSSPYWSSGSTPVNPRGDFRIDERRFRFFEDIS